ncbi:ABC transporter substrate-binding protein [Rhodovastum atsumiense]|uniref:ABC transporter substrate-binding protein n=1 Tax=Rhodovastum atsumiense TaxID=504468 RepID=A0A5M6IXF7_9PROT|nr:ABC transporter substrate-binding protein [Rhodovastum atsumiense]KAA5612941.1 ABC transporter substrate-binding protein [Rhodovastum atsumiense]CAH2600969.1 ABC transporter substrate-binding protein [Rhodovastum atsumiense]
MRARSWLRRLGLAGALAATWAPAQAQKAQDTLRIVWWDQIANINPYYNQLRAGLVVAHHAFDTLVHRDPDSFVIKPLLAVSWKAIDDTTLELDLRRGVKFHDGSPFSADDVIYTINTVLTDRQIAVPANFAWIAGADRIDEYKVRLRFRRVFPAAMEYMAMALPILPKVYRERVGQAAYDRQPVGTGPYRITRVDGGTEIDLERFEDYFPDSPKGRPAIRRLRIHQVADPATAQSELLGDKADWTWNLPPDDVDRLGLLPHLQTTRAETMRVNFLMFDAAGRTGAGNPMTKVKVRQAIAHAIDRQAIAKNIMQGGSRAIDTPCFPTQFGCDPSVAVRYAYDPARARALLAEAGYPDGFRTEMISYLLPQFEAPVQGYLKAVGIDARLVHLQTEAALRRNLEGGNPLYLANWGSYSINDVSAFLPQFFSAGTEGFSDNDNTRDPELKRLVEQGGASTNADERRRYYAAAIRLITEQMYFLPIMTSVQSYAARREVSFRAYPDEIPRFYLTSWR